MALGKLLGKLFGGGAGSPASVEADPVEYAGFEIVPAPIREGGQFRTAGTIRKTIDGEVQQTRFIRADNHNDERSAIDHSIQKGKQVIDEQGESVLAREHA